MKKRGKGEVYNIWQKAGSKESGTWSDLFGWTAGEFMSAWAIANYIDSIAAAGKAVYQHPHVLECLGDGDTPRQCGLDDGGGNLSIGRRGS